MSVSYTIEGIENGVALVRYADNSWAEIVLQSDMTAEDLDDKAYEYRPKTGSAPDFVAEGQSRTAAEKTIIDDTPAYITARKAAYGSVEDQLEYITENGLTAWQTKVAQIKADNPKPSED